MDYKGFIKNNQQKIVLLAGYLLVGLLAFGLGRFSAPEYSAPEIRVEQAFTLPANYTAAVAGTQLEGESTGSLKCEGLIKGSSSLIYHVPGGAFYNRTTNPIRCFDTEAQAKAAGFRKSSR